jgi:hypothetical protein
VARRPVEARTFRRKLVESESLDAASRSTPPMAIDSCRHLLGALFGAPPQCAALRVQQSPGTGLRDDAAARGRRIWLQRRRRR